MLNRGVNNAQLRLRRKQRPELTARQKKEIEEVFELFNLDKSGYMDYYELKMAIRSLGFPDFKKAEAIRLIEDYSTRSSTEPSNKISYDDFRDIMTNMILDRHPEDELMQAFKLFDDDQSGKISLRNLRRVARDIGEKISDDELQAMIDEFDRDMDGEIDFQEFIAVMRDVVTSIE